MVATVPGTVADVGDRIVPGGFPRTLRERVPDEQLTERGPRPGEVTGCRPQKSDLTTQVQDLHGVGPALRPLDLQQRRELRAGLAEFTQLGQAQRDLLTAPQHKRVSRYAVRSSSSCADRSSGSARRCSPPSSSVASCSRIPSACGESGTRRRWSASIAAAWANRPMAAMSAAARIAASAVAASEGAAVVGLGLAGAGGASGRR